jgi:hypothetical protein
MAEEKDNKKNTNDNSSTTESENNSNSPSTNDGGGITSVDGILMLCTAGMLDCLGFGVALIGTWFGIDDYGIIDIMGFIIIGGWLLIKGQGISSVVNKTQKTLSRFIGTSIVEIIPVIGGICPSWTWLVWRELNPKKEKSEGKAGKLKSWAKGKLQKAKDATLAPIKDVTSAVGGAFKDVGGDIAGSKFTKGAQKFGSGALDTAKGIAQASREIASDMNPTRPALRQAGKIARDLKTGAGKYYQEAKKELAEELPLGEVIKQTRGAVGAIGGGISKGVGKTYDTAKGIAQASREIASDMNPTGPALRQAGKIARDLKTGAGKYYQEAKKELAEELPLGEVIKQTRGAVGAIGGGISKGVGKTYDTAKGIAQASREIASDMNPTGPALRQAGKIASSAKTAAGNLASKTKKGMGLDKDWKDRLKKEASEDFGIEGIKNIKNKIDEKKKSVITEGKKKVGKKVLDILEKGAKQDNINYASILKGKEKKLKDEIVDAEIVENPEIEELRKKAEADYIANKLTSPESIKLDEDIFEPTKEQLTQENKPKNFKERVAEKMREEAEKDKARQEERNKKVKELAERFKKSSENKNISSQEEITRAFNEAGNVFNRKITEAGEKYKTKASKILEERNSLIKKASKKYEIAKRNKDEKLAKDAIAWRNEIINLAQKKDAIAKNRLSEEVLKAKKELKEAKKKLKGNN